MKTRLTLLSIDKATSALSAANEAQDQYLISAINARLGKLYFRIKVPEENKKLEQFRKA